MLQVSQHAAKCIPAMVCPEVTEQIRREIAASLHQRKGDFACYFLTDLVTFTLPAGSYKTLLPAGRFYCLVTWKLCILTFWWWFAYRFYTLRALLIILLRVLFVKTCFIRSDLLAEFDCSVFAHFNPYIVPVNWASVVLLRQEEMEEKWCVLRKGCI